jgi:hypothetical protein
MMTNDNYIKDIEKPFYCKRCHSIIKLNRILSKRRSCFDYILLQFNELNITQPDSKAKQVILECKWTDLLQRLIDFGNSYILKSFHLRLEMEEVTK